MTEQMITITKQEYDYLKKESALLEALVGAGVDNWEGYDVAQEQFAEWLENYK